VRRPALLAVLGVGLLLTGCGVPSMPPGRGGPSVVASSQGACSPSVRIDGFSDALNKTGYRGVFVGNLSGLATYPDGTIAALSDRSELFTLDGRTHLPIAVAALRDEQGRELDSEGVTLDTDGTLLITSEVEPSVRRFTRGGRLLGRLPVPAPLLVEPDGRASENLTFEGIALQPDGRLFTSMEAALRGDQGNLLRFQTWNRSGSGFQLGAQYGYRVDPALGVSELTATGDGRLLVLERGYLPGLGNTVRLYLADPVGASDVGSVAQLRQGRGVRLIGKSLLADLVRCPSLGATAKEPQVNPLLDNIEGMTITGRDPAGALSLLLVSDDNRSAKQTTRLYSLTAQLPPA
jgi:hypothetical protein